MKRTDLRIRSQKIRERMAYLKIAKGMTIKECADILELKEKTAEWYWDSVKRIIEGKPTYACERYSIC